MLKSFFEEIKELNYVVQRHWDNLPDGFKEGHNDLDLFVIEEDKSKLQEITNKYPEIKIDIRSFSDNYYPEIIGEALLTNKFLMKDLFFIPNPLSYFLALYYHNLVHKKGDPYKKELEDIFKRIYPSVKCKDEGVGFNS